MLINYLKITLRNLLKQPGITLINVTGLGLGLACFCFFFLYAFHEFSFDQFHSDNDRLFRVYRWTQPMLGEEAMGDPHLPMPLATALEEEFPDVEAAVRWHSNWGENFVRANGSMNRVKVSYADKDAFRVLNFPIKYGDTQTVLSDPKYVVLTESMARKLFGESNPTGKNLEIKIEDSFVPFIVSGVAEDLPTNSSIQFQILGSFDFFAGTSSGQRRANNWNSSFLKVFVKLREGSGLASNTDALLQFRQKYYPDEEQNLREAGYWKSVGPPVTYRFQPFAKMHVQPVVRGGDIPPVNPQSIYILLAIAVGVLLIAIINFTTLSIGRSANRAKEIGVRKIVGSSRIRLIKQFMTEAIVLSTISVLIGILLVSILLPYFNELSGRELSLSFLKAPHWGLFLITTIIITGFLSGTYPALMLSGLKPIQTLKQKIKLSGYNIFTKSLVTIQFALSSALIIATLVIISQLHFLKNKSLGFEKDNILVVDARETDTESIYPIFKRALSNFPQIQGLTAADIGLGEGSGYSRTGFDHKGESKSIYEYFVDHDYIDVMGLELLAGRNFEPGRQEDKTLSVIINESLVKDFGWTLENAVGQELSGYNEEGNEPKVIGVVKDFNFQSLSEAVEPQMFHQFEWGTYEKFLIKIPPGNPASAIARIKSSWNTIVPDFPFKYSFLDEDLDRFYRAEEKFGQIVGWAGGISIFLACLGLLGLAALSAANRTKEIGIRKVLGASIFSIIQLLSKDFLKLVILALLIASPIVWYFVNLWLQNFAYRIDFPFWTFIATSIIAVGVAFLTVSIQSIRTAIVNPVDSLRQE